MGDNIETIEIHGESSVDWQSTAMRYIELNKQKTKAIQRVLELHKPFETRQYRNHQEVMLIGCDECMETGSGSEYFVEYPCPTIKALEGEQ